MYIHVYTIFGAKSSVRIPEVIARASFIYKIDNSPRAQCLFRKSRDVAERSAMKH